MKKRQAKGAKDTFWNSLRVSNGLLIRDIADLLHTSVGTVGGWFSGQKIPSDSNLEKLCNLFDVDVNKGYEEFVKATRAWDSDRGRLHVSLVGPDVPDVPETSKKDKTVEPEQVEDAPQIGIIPETLTEEKTLVEKTPEEKKFYTEVLAHFYGKLSYEDYEKLMACVAKNENPMEVFYGKIDFSDFLYMVNLWAQVG